MPAKCKPKSPKLPTTYERGFLEKLDGRTELSRMLRANRTAIIDDLGGEPELSHIQLAIIDRYIFLEAMLAQLERDIATKPKLTSELVGRWIQAVNSLTGLAKTLGITRKRGCQDWADHKPNVGFLNVESQVISEATK